MVITFFSRFWLSVYTNIFGLICFFLVIITIKVFLLMNFFTNNLLWWINCRLLTGYYLNEIWFILRSVINLSIIFFVTWSCFSYSKGKVLLYELPILLFLLVHNCFFKAGCLRSSECLSWNRISKGLTKVSLVICIAYTSTLWLLMMLSFQTMNKTNSCRGLGKDNLRSSNRSRLCKYLR